MKHKLDEGQLDDGIGWYMQRGKKLWRFAIYLRLPGSDKLIKRRRAGFETRADAERAANLLKHQARYAEAGLTPMSARPTVAELVEKRLPTIPRQPERVRAMRVLGTWLSLLPDGFQIQSVETEHIRLYVERRQAEGKSGPTINRELNTIAATLHAAGEYFGQLRQWKAPKIPRLKGSKSRRERVVTDDEHQRLLSYLRRPPDEADSARPQNRRNAHQARVRVAQIFQFAMLTGARHSEIMRLRWRNLDQPNNRVLIYQSKTDSYKQIPITAPLAELFKEREADPVSPEFVFSESGRIYPKFYRILREACEACGIPYGKDNPDGIVLHTARHTVTTRLVGAGLDLDTVGQITGHRSKELIAHYSHHSPASLARAAAALEAIVHQQDDSERPREVIQVRKTTARSDGRVALLDVEAADGRRFTLRFDGRACPIGEPWEAINGQLHDTQPNVIDQSDADSFPLATTLPQ